MEVSLKVVAWVAGMAIWAAAGRAEMRANAAMRRGFMMGSLSGVR